MSPEVAELRALYEEDRAAGERERGHLAKRLRVAEEGFDAAMAQRNALLHCLRQMLVGPTLPTIQGARELLERCEKEVPRA